MASARRLQVATLGGVGVITLGALLWRVRKSGERRKVDDDPTDAEDFKSWGVELLTWIADYRKRCRDLPVISRVKPNYLRDMLPESAPTKGEPWGRIMTDLETAIVPGLTHWEASNKFFAYFKPHASYPAVLGELLCAGLNVMGFDWIASPACTELEVVTLDWLAKFLNLPSQFHSCAPGPGGGVIQGSAGESATVVLLAALTRIQQRASGKKPYREDMVVYCSSETHAIVQKSCMILGIGHLRSVQAKEEDAWALTADAIEAAIREDLKVGLVPIAIVGTSGTTSSCAFDPLDELAAVAANYGLWTHVDAAYGGAYACLDELKPKFKGLEMVDSFCVNCHKKLLCPFDIAALYVADRKPILDALSLQPEYLRNAASDSGAVVDYEHWQMPLGRRFRALKLWFVLRRFGTEGLRNHVQRGVDLANCFAGLVEAHPAFEISCPVSLSLVCFRLKDRSEDDQMAFLNDVKATGKCFIIHTKLGGKIAMRFACGGVEQSESDVRRAFDVIASCL